MKVKIDKSFQKDLKRINNKALNQKIVASIEDIQKAQSIKEIINLKKLSGTSDFYRIRIGDYRLGVIIEKDTIEFIRCLHRKNIYKYFP